MFAGICRAEENSATNNGVLAGQAWSPCRGERSGFKMRSQLLRQQRGDRSGAQEAKGKAMVLLSKLPRRAAKSDDAERMENP